MTVGKDYEVVLGVLKDLMVAQQSRYERDEVMVVSGLLLPFLNNNTTVSYRQIEICH